MTSSPVRVHVYPDYRCLYIIVVGILVGIGLGPILHVVNPDLYDRMFVGSADIEKMMRDSEAELAEKTATLKAAGASQAAIDEITHEGELGQVVLKAREQDARQKYFLKLLGRTTVLSLAVIVIMVVETLVNPENGRLRGRLVIARYVWIAGWIALVIAQAQMLMAVPFFLFLILLGVTVLFALFPYPPRETVAAEQTQEVKI